MGHPFDNYVLVFIFAQKLDPVTRELWEAESTVRRKTAGRHTLPDMADIFDFVDGRARTLDHVDTQIKLGGQQGAVVVKKTHSVKLDQNQPSDFSNSSTVDAHNAQGYDRSEVPGQVPVLVLLLRSFSRCYSCHATTATLFCILLVTARRKRHTEAPR